MSAIKEEAPQKISRIGIGMAVYEPNVDYFVQQLTSIRKQTHDDWFCVLTFDSPIKKLLGEERLREFREDSRFVWVENEKRLGHVQNFGRAIQECVRRGADAIACSDQDDVWYENKLEVSLNELRAKPPLSMVHCDMHSLEHKGDSTEIQSETTWHIEKRGTHNVGTRHLLVRNVVAGAAMLFDAELAKRFPQIPEAFEYHDHWYAIVASLHGGVYSIEQPLFAYRQHGRNEVGVTPFIGTFTLPKGIRLSDVPDKCRLGWRRTNGMAKATEQAQLLGSPSMKWMFLKPYDFGLGMFFLGLKHLRDDRALSRACFAKAAGKVLSFGS